MYWIIWWFIISIIIACIFSIGVRNNTNDKWDAYFEKILKNGTKKNQTKA